MALRHPGQAIPEITREEHDGEQNAKRVSLISGATIYAVVNTSAGNVTVLVPSGVTVFQGTQPWNSLGTTTLNGLTTLAPSPNYIGLTTGTLGLGDRFIGLVTATQAGLTTLAPSPNYIGLVSIGGGNIGIADSGTMAQVFSPTVDAQASANGLIVHNQGYIFNGTTWDRIRGDITNGVDVDVTRLPSGATVTNAAGTAYIGLASVNIGGGNVGITGNVTLSNPNTYIGLTTTTLGLGDRFIGLVTVANTINANVSLGASPQFIGLVTAVTRNAGTNKTLKILPITLSTNSNTSIAITNTFYITHLLLNSNATVRLNIKSGVTYLTGNASLGVNIFPGGGWVENGSPDSPLYIGQAGAAAIVVEKFDAGGTISQVGGKIVYFDE